MRTVGSKFLELDQLNTEIAELLAEGQPGNNSFQKQAEEARERAEQTARNTGEVAVSPKVESFKPTKELRDLYRKLAKKVHPDLTVDDEDSERRTRTMAEVNKANSGGDIARLKAILNEWETRFEAIEGEDVGAKLARIIRMISWVQNRILQINQELHDLFDTDLYGLKMKVDEAAREGRDLLKEMVNDVERNIRASEIRLEDLKG